jgi:signal transduction histidine kinase
MTGNPPRKKPRARLKQTSAVVACHDLNKELSARQRLEQELADQTAELEDILEALADGLAVFNREGRLLRTNRALRTLMASEADADFLSLPSDERARRVRTRHPDGRPLVPEEWPMARVLRGELELNSAPMEIVVTNLEGRDVTQSVSAAPIRDAAGHVVGGVALYRDVTEQRRLERRTEEALMALLEMTSVLVAAAPNGVPAPTTPGADVSADQTPASDAILPARHAAQRVAELTRSVLGCVRVAITAVGPDTESLRPLAIVGLTPEQEAHMWATWPGNAKLSDSTGQPQIERLRAGEILTADVGEAGMDAQRNPYHARSVLLAPGLLRGELVCLLTTDYGSELHVYSLQEQRLAGAVTALIALVIERERLVAERAQAEARELALQATQKQMDQFISIASHELRTPLTIMKANVQLAARRVSRLRELARANIAPSATPSATEMDALDALDLALQRAEGAVGRQERLVSDLLDVSRIQSGKLELHLAPLDLVALTREIVAEHELAHQQRVIMLAAPAVPVIVQADGDRIRQVLTNYLGNALRYGPVDRPIAVEVRRNEDARTVQVNVRDQGPGVVASEQTRIWDRYYRSPSIDHTAGSGAGLGLGLFICRDIIERHGGQVGVENLVGEGSTFWFSLPLPLASS